MLILIEYILKRRLTVYKLIVSNFHLRSVFFSLSEMWKVKFELCPSASCWGKTSFNVVGGGHCLHLRPPIYGALFLCLLLPPAGIFIHSLSFRKNSRRAAFMLQSAPLYASRIGGRTDGSTNSRRSAYFDVWISPRTIRHAAQFAVGIEAKLAIKAWPMVAAFCNPNFRPIEIKWIHRRLRPEANAKFLNAKLSNLN